METIGSKRSYALTWCMPNNDDDDDDDVLKRLVDAFQYIRLSYFDVMLSMMSAESAVGERAGTTAAEVHLFGRS